VGVPGKRFALFYKVIRYPEYAKQSGWVRVGFSTFKTKQTKKKKLERNWVNSTISYAGNSSLKLRINERENKLPNFFP